MILRRAFMGLAGAAAIGLMASTAMAPEVTLRMHQFLPPQDIHRAAILPPKCSNCRSL